MKKLAVPQSGNKIAVERSGRFFAQQLALGAGCEQGRCCCLSAVRLNLPWRKMLLGMRAFLKAANLWSLWLQVSWAQELVFVRCQSKLRQSLDLKCLYKLCMYWCLPRGWFCGTHWNDLITLCVKLRPEHRGSGMLIATSCRVCWALSSTGCCSETLPLRVDSHSCSMGWASPQTSGATGTKI